MVVGVDGDLALVGGATLDHPRREVPGTTFDLAPGEAPVALDHTVFVTADFGDDVEGVSEVPKGHCDVPYCLRGRRIFIMSIPAPPSTAKTCPVT